MSPSSASISISSRTTGSSGRPAGSRLKTPRTAGSSRARSRRAWLWRKPWVPEELTESHVAAAEKKWVLGELRYVFLELAQWAREKGVLRLVDPNAERRMGKIAQMRLARDYFDVPPWTICWGASHPPATRIVKNLAAERIADSDFVYARRVDCSQLDPRFPWFLQDVAEGAYDTTVLFVAGRCWGFRYPRPRTGHDDWRVFIHSDDDPPWVAWPLSEALEQSIQDFMRAAELRFGRLDFVECPSGPSFLEVNPNGQFGWLDSNDLPLHRAVLKAVLDPANTL